MNKESDVYYQTVRKLQSSIKEIKQLFLKGDYEKIDEVLEQFRTYQDCHYCVGYRKTLEKVGFKGACDGCPVHHYGERQIKAKISYNGCYKVGDYRKMVRAAFWFHTDKSQVALEDVLHCMERVLSEFLKKQAEFCPSA